MAQPGLGLAQRGRSRCLSLQQRAINAIRRNGGSVWMVNASPPPFGLGSYVDSAGTQLVSTTGDLLGLVLDKSRGLTLGAELISTAWTPTSGAVTTSGGGATLVFSAATTADLAANTGVVATGKTYKATFTVSNFVSGGVSFSVGTASQGIGALANGTYQQVFVANATGPLEVRARYGTTTLQVAGISVREIPGNHATQSTTANKPSVAKNSVNKPVMVFDGSNDSLQTSITTGNEGWVCAGVTMSTLGDDYRALFYAGAVDVLQKSVYLIKGNNSFSDGKIALAISNGTTRYVLRSTVPLTPGSPFVADAGWSTSTRCVSVNGHETSEASTGNFGPSAGVLQIGSYFGTNTLNGQATAFIYCPTLPSAADRAVIRKWVGSLQGQTL